MYPIHNPVSTKVGILLSYIIISISRVSKTGKTILTDIFFITTVYLSTYIQK